MSEPKPEWKLEIEIGSHSFKSLRYEFSRVANHISRAEGPHEIFLSWCDNCGGYGWIRCTTPVEERIAELRRQADEMEQRLLRGEV